MHKKFSKITSIQLIPVFLTLFAISYFNYAAINWYVIQSLNASISLFDKGRSFELFKHFPLYPGIIFLGITAGLLFIYLALKIRTRSKRIWWVTIISLLIIPDMVAILVGELFGKDYFSRFKPSTQVQYLPDMSNLLPWTIGYLSKNFVRIVAIILLILNYKKFTLPDQPLSAKSRVIFFPIVLTTLVLYLSYISFGFIKAYEIDYGYNSVQKRTSFHIYRPRYLPGKISQVSEVQTNQELGPYKNAIRIIYDTSFFDKKEQDLDTSQGIIWIAQTRPDVNFDIQKMTRQAIKSDEEEYIELNINNPKDKVGYIRKTNNQNNMNVFNLITENDVLVQVITIHLPLEETIKVAESLR